MSFLKSLLGLGGGTGNSGPAKTLKSVEHNGFLIEAQPYQEGGQYQVAGLITKDVGGEKKQHRFIRADRYPGAEDAADVALSKGRQIVDQLGDKVFK